MAPPLKANDGNETIVLDSDSDDGAGDDGIQFMGIHNPSKLQDIAEQLAGITLNPRALGNHQEQEPVKPRSPGFSTPKRQRGRKRAESSPASFGRVSRRRDDDTIMVMSNEMRIRNKAEIDPVICKQRRVLADSLVEKYGSEQSGWGVKVDRKIAHGVDIIGAIWVAICPSFNNGASFLFGTGSAMTSSIHYDSFHHFPPYRVKIEYISARYNNFRILVSCLWLGRDHLKSLNAEIERIVSYDKPGDSPVDVALNFVERKSVPFLGIMDNKNTILCLPSDHEKISASCLRFGDPTFVQKAFQDINKLRATLAPVATTLAFDCDICYSHVPSLTAVLFRECRHYFCRPCVKQAFEVKVAEKAVNEFTCLANNCSTVAGQDMIKLLLDGPEFRSYCDITTDFLLDSGDSKQFIRCPRKECNVAMEIFMGPGYNEHPIRCLTCKQIFCVMCKRPPHPGQSCLSDEEKRKIRDEYRKADELGKKILEKRYGAENVKFALEDAESEEWIKGNSKPCPVCKTPIQKNEGCNKMVCSAKGCRTFFCWICLKNLADLNNPYEHFANGQCSGKLWEGVNLNAGFPAAPPAGFVGARVLNPLRQRYARRPEFHGRDPIVAPQQAPQRPPVVAPEIQPPGEREGQRAFQELLARVRGVFF